jgi:hypothetical protein
VRHSCAVVRLFPCATIRRSVFIRPERQAAHLDGFKIFKILNEQLKNTVENFCHTRCCQGAVKRNGGARNLS